MTALERVTQGFEKIRAHGERPVWITLAEERALAKAQAIDAALPLAGLTFAVKDNIDLEGVPTTAGCPEYAYTPQESATIVRLLEAAGAIAVGKTNLDQFATGLVGVRTPYGACRSVFHEDYISGGSSSGSAVAVALGQVDFSLGTDTAGSGRVPAAFNGLIGLKPTRGVFSMSGVVPACRTLDCPSVFARDLTMARRVFDVIARYDASDWSSRAFVAVSAKNSGFAFGVPHEGQLEFFGDKESEHLYWNAVERFSRAGGTRVAIDYTPFRETANLLYSGPWVAERLAAIRSFLEAKPEALYPVTWKIIEGAKSIMAADAFESMYRLGGLRQAANAQMADCDFLLLPTAGTIYTVAAVEAEPFKLNTNLGYYTNFVNLLDMSALAIPAGFRANGTSFGVSLIGRAMDDLALLDYAQRTQTMPLAVVGAHLTGQPLNAQLTGRGATLRKRCRTAPAYRLFALANTTPPKPGLVREDGFAGEGIEVEVWDMPEHELGSFLALIPPPLGLGTIQLDDGTSVKGFICESAALAGATEITSFGGWRNYLASAYSERKT